MCLPLVSRLEHSLLSSYFFFPLPPILHFFCSYYMNNYGQQATQGDGSSHPMGHPAGAGYTAQPGNMGPYPIEGANVVAGAGPHAAPPNGYPPWGGHYAPHPSYLPPPGMWGGMSGHIPYYYGGPYPAPHAPSSAAQAGSVPPAQPQAGHVPPDGNMNASMPPPPPPASQSRPSAVPAAANVTEPGSPTRAARLEGGSQNGLSERDRGRRDAPLPPQSRAYRSRDERSRSPNSRRSPPHLSSAPPLRQRFESFASHLDDMQRENQELRRQNLLLERRNSDLTQQVHDLIRGHRPQSRSRRQEDGYSSSRRSSPHRDFERSRAGPSLQDRLSSRVPTQMQSPPITEGGPVTNAALHGRWIGYSVNTRDDYYHIRDAARDRNDDDALMYITYVNATQQRLRTHQRTEGVSELLQDWGSFSRPLAARRAALLDRHQLRSRQSTARQSIDLTQSPDRDAVHLPEAPTIIDVDATPSPRQPDRAISESRMDTDDVPTPVRTQSEPATMAPSSMSIPTVAAPLPSALTAEDNPSAPMMEDERSEMETTLAALAPREWPVGVCANIDGQRVTAPHTRDEPRLTPWADDVHAYEVIDSLAPALLADDPTSTDRRDLFRHTAILLFAVEDYASIITGHLGSPLGDRAVEHYPFEMDPFNVVHVAAWFRDHGVDIGSVTADNLRSYALSAWPYRRGATSEAPPPLNAMFAGTAYQKIVALARNFQYPAVHFTQTRSYITATEQYFNEWRAGDTHGWGTYVPSPRASPVPRIPRPTTGPYSLLPSSGSPMASTSAPPTFTAPATPPRDPRRSPSEELDFEGSDDDSATKRQ